MLSLPTSGVTDCQRRGLRCSEKGDFLPAQPDFLSGRWRCVSREGLDLDWSNSEKALTDEECSGKSLVPNQKVLLDRDEDSVKNVEKTGRIKVLQFVSCVYAIRSMKVCRCVIVVLRPASLGEQWTVVSIPVWTIILNLMGSQ